MKNEWAKGLVVPVGGEFERAKGIAVGYNKVVKATRVVRPAYSEPSITRPEDRTKLMAMYTTLRAKQLCGR